MASVKLVAHVDSDKGKSTVEILENEIIPELHPTITAFGMMLERDDRLRRLCSSMFLEAKQVGSLERFIAGHRLPDSISSLMILLNSVLYTTPEWRNVDDAKYLVGLPVTQIFSPFIVTPSGHVFFAEKAVNLCIKNMLGAWGAYLKTQESTYALNSRDGWLSPTALTRLEAVANEATGHKRKFTEIFVCPDEHNPDTLGFESWDAFFSRRLKPGVRPIPIQDMIAPGSGAPVFNACESQPMRLSSNCSEYDQFWLKGHPYSISDMLDHVPLAKRFVNGTVYQAHLSVMSYHRWHAPIAGTIREVKVLAGSYYPRPLGASFEQMAELESFLTAVATRALIFIEADDPRIGMLCMVAVGMLEVSSCVPTVHEGDHVEPGDDIGSFHYGGSTHCLVFESGVHFQCQTKLDFSKMQNTPINSLIGYCTRVNSVTV